MWHRSRLASAIAAAASVSRCFLVFATSGPFWLVQFLNSAIDNHTCMLDIVDTAEQVRARACSLLVSLWLRAALTCFLHAISAGGMSERHLAQKVHAHCGGLLDCVLCHQSFLVSRGVKVQRPDSACEGCRQRAHCDCWQQGTSPLLLHACCCFQLGNCAARRPPEQVYFCASYPYCCSATSLITARCPP